MPENTVGGDAVIAEIRRLLEQITPGDWRLWHGDEGEFTLGSKRPDYPDDGVWPYEFVIAQRGPCGERAPEGIANAQLFFAAPRLLAWCLSRLEAQAPCVCRVDDGLVQEWVSKAREVAKSKGFTVAKVRLEAQAQALPGWRDIETAPKDGTEVLLTDGRYKRTGYWARRINAWSVDAVGPLAAPTHWLSLPAPRTAALASSETSQEKA